MCVKYIIYQKGDKGEGGGGVNEKGGGFTNTKICIFRAKYTAGDFVRWAHAHLLIRLERAR